MNEPHISNRLKFGDDAPAAPEPFRFAEFTVVSLTRDVDVDGRTLPSGTQGMIIDAHADGVGYTVEFEAPMAVAVVLTSADFTG